VYKSGLGMWVCPSPGSFNRFIKEMLFTLEFRGRTTMPICEICGLEVVTVFECSQCEAKFCEECGDVKRKLCFDCIGWEEEDLDESWDPDRWDKDLDDEPQ